MDEIEIPDSKFLRVWASLFPKLCIGFLIAVIFWAIYNKLQS